VRSTSQTRRRLLAGGGALGLLAGKANSVVRPPYMRGVSIYHIAGSSDRLTPDKSYVRPFFSGPREAMSDAEMRALAVAGFDFVRLLVAPDLPMRSSRVERAELNSALAAVIRRFKAAGLKTVVDLHSGHTLPGYSDAEIQADPASPVFLRYVAMVSEVAGFLATVDPDVALEIFNEPVGYSATELKKWSGMQAMLHDSARSAAPGLPLILSGAKGGSKEGLLDIDPQRYRRSNVLWSFHYYEPHVFTHQSAEGRYAPLHDVPWPAGLASRGELLRMVATVGLAGSRPVGPDLVKYALSGDGPHTVETDIGQVAIWADNHGVRRDRIFMGEFGVARTVGTYRGAPEADRIHWLTKVRSAAERAGFGWSLWCYSGPGSMTLANQYPAVTLDGSTLLALGLRTS
jgi:endoglucanase